MKIPKSLKGFLFGAYFGGSLQGIGVHLWSWQFWVVLLPTVVLAVWACRKGR